MAKKGEKNPTVADDIEAAKRVEQALGSLLDGNTIQATTRALMTEYGIGQSQAYRYTQEASTRMHAKIDETIEQKISKHYRRLERLYAKCIRDGDKRTAKAVLKDLADLDGLDAPKRTDITSGGEPIPLEIRMINVGDATSDNE